MTAHETPLRFLDTPVSRLQALLRAWRYGPTRSVWPLAERIRLSPQRTLVLLEGARRAGLIGDTDEPYAVQPSLTPEGVQAAHHRQPIPKARARASARLEGIIARVVGLEARADLPFQIDQVWLSGEMLDPHAGEIGAITLTIVHHDEGARLDALTRYYDLARRFAMTIPAGQNPADSLPPQVRSWLIYDGVRPGQVRERPIQALLARPTPCRCLYDRRRGGVVHDPILAHHPEARVEEDTLAPCDLRAILALPSERYRPFDARLLNAREIVAHRYERFGPWPSRDPRYAAIRSQGIDEAAFLVASEKRITLADNVVSRRLTLRRIDGRARIALALGQRDPRKAYLDRSLPPVRAQIAAVVERRIVRRRTGTEYRLQVARTDRLKGPRDEMGVQADLLTWWLHILASTDREGLRLDPLSPHPITVTVRVLGDSPFDQALKKALERTPEFGQTQTEESRAPPEPVPA